MEFFNVQSIFYIHLNSKSNVLSLSERGQGHDGSMGEEAGLQANKPLSENLNNIFVDWEQSHKVSDLSQIPKNNEEY